MEEHTNEISGLNEVLARDILAKIERGEQVEYDRIIIKEDLDLSRLNLRIEHIERTDNEKDFLGLSEEVKIVLSSISLKNSMVNGILICRNIYFKSNCNFLNTTFGSDAYFNGAFFNQVAFTGAKFKGGAQFNGALFKGPLTSFYGVQFYGNSSFYNAKFCGGIIEFSDSKFNCKAYFQMAQLDSYANFNGAEFKDEAYFDGIQFSYRTDFKNTRFDKMYIRWENIKNKFAYDETLYLLLIDNFKKLGFFEDADECYYFYRIKYHNRSPIRRIFDLVARFSFGYGVKPARPLIWSALIILLSGIIFKIYLSTSFADAFFLSATAFTSSVNPVLISTLAGIPKNGYPLWIFTMERLLGTLFFTLFLASIGRTIIR